MTKFHPIKAPALPDTSWQVFAYDQKNGWYAAGDFSETRDDAYDAFVEAGRMNNLDRFHVSAVRVEEYQRIDGLLRSGADVTHEFQAMLDEVAA